MEAVTQSTVQAHRPIEWRVAARALVGLATDTSRTDHVFTIISALTGDTFERTYEAFCATPHGQKLLRERTSLLAILSDRPRLEAMPEGSFGRAYLEFMDRAKITGVGLVSAQDARYDPNGTFDLDPDRRYVSDRMRDMHDLWHVLTDYGPDDTGEIANLWFSVGQFGNPGMAFIAFFGAIGGRIDETFSWHRYCYKAYLRGKRARRLISEPLEEMLELPLDEVRRRLEIAPTVALHPEGVRRGYRRDHELGALPLAS
jgi:ubiquinone biosynthesis protein COQ4